MRFKPAIWIVLASFSTAFSSNGQGAFQNLDFEGGMFVPIPNDPLGSVQWGPAMPGWTGYLGTTTIDWIWYNSRSIGNTPGISIYGPDNPTPDSLHGHYYVILQSGITPGPTTVVASIAQRGLLPLSARSVRFYTLDSYPLINVSFAGAQIPLTRLGGDSSTYYIWGGDISNYAGLSGEIRFSGGGYLDYIQFSDQPIPEPSGAALLGLGLAALAWRTQRKRFA